MTETVEVMGVPVDVAGMEDVEAACLAALRGDRSRMRVVAVNPEKVMAARANPVLLRAIRDAELRIADGIGVVLALRRWGWRNATRVPGVELADRILGLASSEGAGVFLIGAEPEIAEVAGRRLQRRFPGLRVVGARDGFGARERDAEDVEAVNRSGASVLLVGMGSPRQEEWVSENWMHLRSVRVCQCVGGSIDVFAGRTRRAPRLARILGMEWLYRLLAQPGRLKRQGALPRFGMRALFDRHAVSGGAGSNRSTD